MKKLLIAVVLGVATLSFALESGWVRSAHAAPSADAVAMQLARVVMSKESYESLIKQMMSSMLKASGQAADAKTSQQLQAVMLDVLPYDEMLQFNAKVYAKRFKDSELQDIVAFYKTPTGAKLVRAMPDITGDVGELIGKIIPERLPAAMKKHGLGK